MAHQSAFFLVPHKPQTPLPASAGLYGDGIIVPPTFPRRLLLRVRRKREARRARRDMLSLHCSRFTRNSDAPGYPVLSPWQPYSSNEVAVTQDGRGLPAHLADVLCPGAAGLQPPSGRRGGNARGAGGSYRAAPSGRRHAALTSPALRASARGQNRGSFPRT